MDEKQKTVVVTKELADRIEVLRFNSEEAGGFQRPIRKGRAQRMAEGISRGGFCPDIVVGDLRGRLVMIDGQHRLEAWKLSAFPLRAIIIKLLDMNHAKRIFVDLNDTQVRVARGLRLAVDPREYAMRIRALAAKYETGITQIDNAALGIHRARVTEMIEEEWQLLEKGLAFWHRDKRWAKTTNVFTRPTVLRAIFNIAGQTKDILATLEEIKSLDFSIGGKLDRYSGKSLKSIKTLIYDHIAKRVLA